MRFIALAIALLLAGFSTTTHANERRLAPARHHRAPGAQPNGEQCGNGNVYCADGEACTQGHDCVVVCGEALCWYQLQDAWSDCPGGNCVCQ
jgi:hypothetical protein